MDEKYPGTLEQQALLAAIVDYYRNDHRILALCLFGSLARGTGDKFSDLDLDAVIGDDVRLDVSEELRRLCSSFVAIGEKDALIVADGVDAGDVVLSSLRQFSIRYHPLRTTSPNIVDSLVMLAGRLDPAQIVVAGLANYRQSEKTLDRLLNQCVRYILAVDVALQRDQLWGAVEMLHRIRGLVMEMFTLAYGGVRPLGWFQSSASRELQLHLAKTVPPFDQGQLQAALEHCLELLENDLDQISGGQLVLGDIHRNILRQVRARQLTLGK